MILYVGCSYTWGSGLQYEYLLDKGWSVKELNKVLPVNYHLEHLSYEADEYRKQNNWPNLVSKELNKSFVIGTYTNGGSNLSTTLPVLNNTGKIARTNSIDLVVVQFTDWLRDMNDREISSYPGNIKDIVTEEFIETSVRLAGGNWVARFESVLDQATSIHYVTKDGYNGEDTLYTFCNDVLLGFAAMRGRGMDEDPRLLVFWDGQPGAEGGTGELVKKWKKNFNEPIIIDAKQVLQATPEIKESPGHGGETNPAFLITDDPKVLPRTIKTMLFADVEGFSRLDETMTPYFVEKFLGGISEIIGRLTSTPAFVNTWGDSFFAVFESTEDALKLALDIRDYFNKGSWKDLLVEGEMEIRISMHAGPVYEEFDPILNRRNFFGRHVNQAARIEPIVLPGSVFVSETVAALISFGYEKYDFEYAGNLELAKDFGSYPIYMLQRKGYSGEEERA